MARVYISIGSNVEREANLKSSIANLETEFGCARLSGVYESPAVGFDGNDFYNLVAEVHTDKSVYETDRILTRIEDEHGRIRSGPKFSPRTLDLDLLLYDDLIIHEDNLEVPRDEIPKYAFVLLPLTEIAADQRHPVLKKTYAEMWAEFDRASQPIQAIDFNWKSNE